MVIHFWQSFFPVKCSVLKFLRVNYCQIHRRLPGRGTLEIVIYEMDNSHLPLFNYLSSRMLLLDFCLLFPLLEKRISHYHKKMLKIKVKWSLGLLRAVQGAGRCNPQRFVGVYIGFFKNLIKPFSCRSPTYIVRLSVKTS